MERKPTPRKKKKKKNEEQPIDYGFVLESVVAPVLLEIYAQTPSLDTFNIIIRLQTVFSPAAKQNTVKSLARRRPADATFLPQIRSCILQLIEADSTFGAEAFLGYGTIRNKFDGLLDENLRTAILHRLSPDGLKIFLKDVDYNNGALFDALSIWTVFIQGEISVERFAIFVKFSNTFELPKVGDQYYRFGYYQRTRFPRWFLQLFQKSATSETIKNRMFALADAINFSNWDFLEMMVQTHDFSPNTIRMIVQERKIVLNDAFSCPSYAIQFLEMLYNRTPTECLAFVQLLDLPKEWVPLDTDLFDEDACECINVLLKLIRKKGKTKEMERDIRKRHTKVMQKMRKLECADQLPEDVLPKAKKKKL